MVTVISFERRSFHGALITVPPSTLSMLSLARPNPIQTGSLNVMSKVNELRPLWEAGKPLNVAVSGCTDAGGVALAAGSNSRCLATWAWLPLLS